MSTDVRFVSAPLACIPDAIPVTERAGHFARARRLFSIALRESHAIPSGRAYRFEPAELEELSRWIALEQRCCPFLTFAIELGSGGALWLSLTGPEGTPAFLEAELALATITHSD